MTCIYISFGSTLPVANKGLHTPPTKMQMTNQHPGQGVDPLFVSSAFVSEEKNYSNKGLIRPHEGKPMINKPLNKALRSWSVR